MRPRIEHLEARFKLWDHLNVATQAAYAVEDLGIIELGEYVGTAEEFGVAIRKELTLDGFQFRPTYICAYIELLRVSAGSEEADLMLKLLARLAANQMFLRGAVTRYGHKA